MSASIVAQAPLVEQAPDPMRLLTLAADCGRAEARRGADFGRAARRFRDLVRHPSLADAPTVRLALVGAYVAAFREARRARRIRRAAQLAAVIAEDRRESLIDPEWRPWEMEAVL